MKQFIKKEELQLLNGGYISNSKGEPVCNWDFQSAQKNAEFVITFAEKAKGKDFKGKDAEDLNKFRQEVWDLLNESKTKSYISAPIAPKRITTEKLKEEALAFIGYQEDVEKTEKVNKFLNQFNIIAEFEEYGLFFEQNICKLNKIYTIEEIVKATESVIDLL